MGQGHELWLCTGGPRIHSFRTYIHTLMESHANSTCLVHVCTHTAIMCCYNSIRIDVRWAEAPIKIARMTLTIKLDGNWNSFQLANNTPPLSVTGSVIAPSARMLRSCKDLPRCKQQSNPQLLTASRTHVQCVREGSVHNTLITPALQDAKPVRF